MRYNLIALLCVIDIKISGEEIEADTDLYMWSINKPYPADARNRHPLLALIIFAKVENNLAYVFLMRKLMAL